MAEQKDRTIDWLSPKEAPFQMAGFAWFETDRIYRRMPVRPPKPLPQAVDGLANCTAGGQIRFQTDSPQLSIRVRLTGLAGMNHMPATGQCGFDCYLGPAGNVRYCSTTKYDHTQRTYEVALYNFPGTEMRHVTLFFPLYQGVEEVSLGLVHGSDVRPPVPFRNDRRVVVYGTSITQGGCAARPGTAYTNILSRRLNVEFINLGFSGSGRGEPEVAETIAQISRPACFVLDYEANCVSTPLLRETFPRFIEILRRAHPYVPILAVSRIPFAGEVFSADARHGREERRDLQRQVVESLRDQGDRLVFFKDGQELLGLDFDECTVDGSHPTDLGFMQMANALEPVLKALLVL
jgi:lysophospholipase L1-like esterase